MALGNVDGPIEIARYDAVCDKLTENETDIHQALDMLEKLEYGGDEGGGAGGEDGRRRERRAMLMGGIRGRR